MMLSRLQLRALSLAYLATTHKANDRNNAMLRNNMDTGKFLTVMIDHLEWIYLIYNTNVFYYDYSRVNL